MAKVLLIIIAFCLSSGAEELKVAVASNFSGTLQELLPDFEKTTGNKVLVISGSTAMLATQIRQKAPFDIFLSADTATVEDLVQAGFAFKESIFIYAKGVLVLWSPRKDLLDSLPCELKSKNFKHLALAKPELAPYGMAAKVYLQQEQLWDVLQDKIVWAQNITQAYQFVASQNAEFGFVALSQALNSKGSFCKVERSPKAPLEQAAVILKSSAQKTSAESFMKFLATDAVQAKIKHLGYQ